MEDLGEAISAIENSAAQAIPKDDFLPVLKALQSEISDLRAVISVLYRANTVDGPTDDVRKRVTEIAHSLSKPIEPQD